MNNYLSYPPYPHPKDQDFFPINKVQDCFTVHMLQIHEVNNTTEASCIMIDEANESAIAGSYALDKIVKMQMDMKVVKGN